MFEWIENNKEIITVFTSIATLLVWVIYAQLLYLSFRRQRSPSLIINRGRNKDINALCIISNMSAESIFIQYIIVELETSEGKITMDVTDLEQAYNKGDEHKQRQQSSNANMASSQMKTPARGRSDRASFCTLAPSMACCSALLGMKI